MKKGGTLDINRVYDGDNDEETNTETREYFNRIHPDNLDEETKKNIFGDGIEELEKVY
jgi:hypothetical protein